MYIISKPGTCKIPENILSVHYFNRKIFDMNNKYFKRNVFNPKLFIQKINL